MTEFDYARALGVLSRGVAVDLDRLLATACAPAWDPLVYLADFSRQLLLPLSPGAAGEPVAGTLPGRVFSTGRTEAAVHGGYTRVWVPVLEQTSRIGVLAVSVLDGSEELTRQAELLGVFAGLVVAGLGQVSDIPRIRRQGQRMSLPASMQWDLLPPWTIRVPGATIAGILEPAYDIAGDAYDYADGDGVLQFGVIDGMGHGIGATRLAGLAVGAYRHARRAGTPLPQVHAAIDKAIAASYDDLSFATGLIGRLTVSSGRLEWTCAGHPPPLLLRGQRVIGELDCRSTPPFGLGAGAAPVSTRDLEPGDAVLFYTDGVTEAHAPGGELFGLDRLSRALERESAGDYQPEQLLRGLVREVLGHHEGALRDDATLLLVRWTGRRA
jgi:hypothetical protein